MCTPQVFLMRFCYQSVDEPHEMCTSVPILLIAFVSLTQSLIVNLFPAKDISSKIRKELKSLTISCELGDLVILSAPVVSGKEPVYHLYNPRGEFRKLDLHPPKEPKKNFTDYDMLSVKSYNDNFILTPLDNYKVFNVNFGPNHGLNQNCAQDKGEDEFACYERQMEANDFMIGPLSEDDYGNWVISAFFKNDDGDWVEVYQTVTIDIRQIVPAAPKLLQLNPGDTYEFGFAYPIHGLKSCELTAPRSAFDRFYSMNRLKLNQCGYVVRNVTLTDSGYWRIIGVGRIAYEALLVLRVKDPTANKDGNEKDKSGHKNTTRSGETKTNRTRT